MEQRRTFQHVEKPREPLTITLSIVIDEADRGTFAVCASAAGAPDMRFDKPLFTLADAAAEAKRISRELTARGYQVRCVTDLDALLEVA